MPPGIWGLIANILILSDLGLPIGCRWRSALRGYFVPSLSQPRPQKFNVIGAHAPHDTCEQTKYFVPRIVSGISKPQALRLGAWRPTLGRPTLSETTGLLSLDLIWHC
jgi:hypothetical protein